MARPPLSRGREPRSQPRRNLETQERANEAAMRFSETSGLEFMISSPMKAQFEAVLRVQHLIDDLPIIAAPAYFDEIPLYSRYQQVNLLKQFGSTNLLLVELALEYLERVVAAMQPNRLKRFVAVTIISHDDKTPIIPQIFVCNGDVDQHLSGLQLTEPSEGLGRQIEELVREARPGGEFSVLEDHSTVSGEARVFIASKSPPHGFVPLERFYVQLDPIK